ncbi:YraN family protein [Paracoccus sp. (in: a-proteobacteria)]|uniref:YraN family protein n=1 Tax=Paracoccus sp. TaxID=267 RepID=UPI0026DED973|nr:YraN family protein [Paracoccus sp. (in: a-proteobacteria)]MDO5646343.1 YraN family protein [Paracoccus sp. (in: a-proteobacteria)]
MAFDMVLDHSTAAPSRRRRGQRAYQSGLMAEDSVSRLYLRRGATLLASRWRGKAGEIDLIFQDGADIVFVEVKASSTHRAAAERLGRAQMDRICLAACEFCDANGFGGLASMRFDVALVDAQGRVDLIDNAFGAF